MKKLNMKIKNDCTYYYVFLDPAITERDYQKYCSDYRCVILTRSESEGEESHRCLQNDILRPSGSE